MKLTLGLLFGSKNARINISNLPTHFLMRLHFRRSRPVWNRGYRVEQPLNEKQRMAVRNLLRLRNVKRGALKVVL